MAAHASTLTRPENPRQPVVMWPISEMRTQRGWPELASNLTVPNLDWNTAAAGLGYDASDRCKLFEVVGCLLESVSLPGFLAAALKVSDCLIPATATGFDLLDPLTSRPLQVAGKGVSASFLQSYELGVRSHDTVLGAVVTSRESHQCSDLFSSEGWRNSSAYCDAFGLMHLAHVLYVPIVIEDYVIGTLNFGRTDAVGRFPSEEIALAGDLAMILARTIAQELSRSETSEMPAPSPEPDCVTSALSAREVSIANLVSRGFRDQEIADHVGLSLHTVKQYLKQIYRKTSLRSRVDLAVCMVTHDSTNRCP